jgi:hypothetical protein
MAQAEGLQFPEERVLMLVIAEAYIKMAERVAVRYGRGTAHRDQSEAHPQDDS